MIDFGLRRATNVHWQALDVNTGARRASRTRSRRCCGSPACRARANPPSPIWWKKPHRAKAAHLSAGRRQCPPRPQPDLGFTDADRVENIRRVGEAAKLFVDAGLIVLVLVHLAVPLRTADGARPAAAGEFIEIFVDTPIEVCIDARSRRASTRARGRRDQEFHRHRQSYEAPEPPELTLNSAGEFAEALADRVVKELERRGRIVAL